VSIFLIFSALAGFEEDNSLDLGEKIIEKRFDKLKAVQAQISYEDLQHPNKGCPENSVCSQAMGVLHGKFHQFILKLKDQNLNEKQKAKELETYRQQHGLPLYFLATKATYAQFSPIMYNSACYAHNPSTGETIFKSLAFITGTEKNMLHIKRSPDIFTVPQGDVATLSPIEIYLNKKWHTYYIPYGEKPLFIDGDKIIFNDEYENVIYNISTDNTGKWNVIPLESLNPNVNLSGGRIDCPSGSSLKENKFFQNFYCMNVYDIKTKKEVIARLPFPCL